MTFPLFLHVLGAMLLVGTLLAVATSLVLDWRLPEGSAGLRRLGLRTMLIAVVPAYVLMRVGAEWTVGQAPYGDPAWITIGYVTADAGALLILISLVLAGVALRRGGRVPARVVGAISVVLLAAYVVTVWAMSVKPG